LKKIFSIFIIGVLVLSGLGAVANVQEKRENILFEKLEISTPRIIEKTDYISIDLTEANSNYWEEGKPFLPVISKVFTFDFGTKIDNVEVTFEDITTQKLSKLIEPSPKIEIRSSVNNQITEKESDIVDYSKLEIYPNQRYTWSTASGIKGTERVIYCSVGINPVQYNTNENTISYARNADIIISFTPPANPMSFPEEYDLLIITPTEFKSTLQRFVDHKESRNIKTKLVTLNEIPSQGSDTQESIKYFIKDAIETWGVDYLILVGGGVEGNEKFPVRKAWIGSSPYEDYFPSDLYYADIYNSTMEFSNWDYDGDGKYAEYPRDKPNMDIAPDIHLGKIPCNTNSELNAYIDKVIWYDKHNKMTNKIVQIGGDTFPGDPQNINEGEYANDVVLSVLPGYTSTKLWASQDTVTIENIADGYIEMKYDFVDFSGHGSPRSFSTHPPGNDKVWIPEGTLIQPYGSWDIFSFSLYLVKNSKKYPIVFHNACSNNKYIITKSDCLSWMDLKHPNGGAIIAFGASGIGFGGQGTAEVQRNFGWMEVHTHKQIYETKNLGQVWTNCITDYFNEHSPSLKKEDYKTLVEYSMFGDPTINAIDGDEPRLRDITSNDLNIFEGLSNYFPRIFRLFGLLFR